ncbi:DUF2157 domain-containing protein [bacterium]|jgi:uncharacterized membrane protein|nr:DUF2157 domain-containing protein [bacterium]
MELDPHLRSRWKNLYRDQKIPLTLYREGLRLLKPVLWDQWISQGFLILGSLLLGSGILFFFAYNWDSMPRGAKLGLAQLPVLVTLILVFFRDLNSLPTKVLLFLGAFFVGVFLAVFGQVYQTGADSYELFQGWALLIFPLSLFSNFLPLWTLNLVLVHAAFCLFWQQIIGTNSSIEFTLLFLILAALDGLCLTLWEYFHSRGLVWLKRAWARPVLYAAILTSLLIPCSHIIMKYSPHRVETSAWIALFITPVVAALLAGFSWRARDLVSLSVVALGIACLGDMLLFRFLDYLSGPRWFEHIAISIGTLGLFCALAWLLLRVQHRFSEEQDHV